MPKSLPPSDPGPGHLLAALVASAFCSFIVFYLDKTLIWTPLVALVSTLSTCYIIYYWHLFTPRSTLFIWLPCILLVTSIYLVETNAQVRHSPWRGFEESWAWPLLSVASLLLMVLGTVVAIALRSRSDSRTETSSKTPVLEKPAGGPSPVSASPRNPMRVSRLDNLPRLSLEAISEVPVSEKLANELAPISAKPRKPLKERDLRSLDRPLRAFLCHSSLDKPVVRDLYSKLINDRFDPWLDEEKLMAGQDWEAEIRKAVKESDVVIICLSRSWINDKGFIQKEIKFALDVADEQPEGTIYLIPLRLEECELPTRLQKWHYVNYYQESGYDRLKKSLNKRAGIGSTAT